MEKSVHTGTYLQFRQLMIDARKNAGLTQVALAERLREFQSFVSRFERGERRLDVVEFIEVANAIGVNPHDILEALGVGATGRPTKKSRQVRTP